MEEPKENGVNRMQDPKTGKFIKGNPGGGRPKGSFSLVEMIKDKLKETPEGYTKTYAEQFIEKLMRKSIIEGDTSIMKDIIDRVDGKAIQRIGTPDGESFNLGVIVLPEKNVCQTNSLSEGNDSESKQQKSIPAQTVER